MCTQSRIVAAFWWEIPEFNVLKHGELVNHILGRTGSDVVRYGRAFSEVGAFCLLLISVRLFLSGSEVCGIGDCFLGLNSDVFQV